MEGVPDSPSSPDPRPASEKTRPGQKDIQVVVVIDMMMCQNDPIDFLRKKRRFCLAYLYEAAWSRVDDAVYVSV